MERLIELMESRIRRNVYVRFGGEHLKTYHSNMERRWVLSLQHKILFPVVTVIIMEAFINKMRRLHGVRKMIVVEEAWKAIAREGMADYIKFLYKTVRKYFGEAVVVTQELDDIVSSPIIKDTIINNADCKILLDQRKYINKFDSVQSLLGLTDKEKGQILSINQSNDPARKYKEV